MAHILGNRTRELGLGRCTSISCLAAAMVFAVPATAQSPMTPSLMTPRPEGQNSVAKPAVATAEPQSVSPNEAGVVRLARFSYVEGQVLWRADSGSQWAAATINLPIREGTQITTDSQAHAEIQFDDGSTLRMTDDAVLTLTKLSSDADGETTELSMKDGTATLHAMNAYSTYQVDTPDGEVHFAGPARIRLDATSYLMVGVQQGTATFDTVDGKYSLKEGDLANVKPSEAKPEIDALPAPDDWDQFCDSREADLQPDDAHMPSDVAMDAGNLDQDGTWQADPNYGDVWYPSDQTADWQPYTDGNWTWVQTFGWTWVSVKRWGWAPFHYGTWIHKPKGWAWVPGPLHQRWSPAVVWFTTLRGRVVWTPLAPCEVHYTAPKVAFKHGDWSKYFSVGGAGTYQAAGPDYVVAKEFPRRPVGPVRLSPVDHAFRPHNSVTGGTVIASLDGFLSGKGFKKGPVNSLALFLHGSTLVARGGGLAANIRPTVASSTPKRAFVENSTSIETLNRPVPKVHDSLPAVLRPTFRDPAASNPVTFAKPSAPVPTASRPAYRPQGSWNSGPVAKPNTPASVSPAPEAPAPDVTVRHSPRRESPAPSGGPGTAEPRSGSVGAPQSPAGSPAPAPNRPEQSPRERGPRPAPAQPAPQAPAPTPQPRPQPQAPAPAPQPRPQPQAPAPAPQPRPQPQAPAPEPPRQEQPRPEPPRQEPPRQEPPRPQPQPQPQKPDPGKH